MGPGLSNICYSRAGKTRLQNASFSTDTALAIGERWGTGQYLADLQKKGLRQNLRFFIPAARRGRLSWNLPLTLVCRSCQRPNSTMGDEGPKGIPVKISQLFLKEWWKNQVVKLLINLWISVWWPLIFSVSMLRRSKKKIFEGHFSECRNKKSSQREHHKSRPRVDFVDLKILMPVLLAMEYFGIKERALLIKRK